jgi:outer membrane receptor protein involved in Fe transport
LAGGDEVRYETYRDDRDARQDGSIPFVDTVTGARYGSDLLGISPSPDVSGSRLVASAFAEISLPVVDPTMRVPWVRALSLQVAGRFENYSDVGAVAKPKLAGSWDVVDGVRLRASWSQGFRAPNLEILHSPALQRSNLGVDYLRCEMDLRAGRIASYSTCSETFPVVRIYTRNPDLKPEESENYSLGLVLRPRLAKGWGSLALSVDQWRIGQKKAVGVLDYQNAINLDYLMRLGGASNPNVIRATVTADDVALAAGTGLAPVGQLQEVRGVYQNLPSRVVEGVDLGLSYRSPATRFGDFAFDFNYARLTAFHQKPSQEQQALIEARSTSKLGRSVPITGAGDLIGQAGNPSEKWTATLTWRSGPAQVAGFVQRTAPVYEPDVVDPLGNPYGLRSQLTANLYGQWTFRHEATSRTTIRMGVRNMFNTQPPLASNGYLAGVYSPIPRYLYLAVERTF